MSFLSQTKAQNTMSNKSTGHITRSRRGAKLVRRQLQATTKQTRAKGEGRAKRMKYELSVT